MIGVLAAVSVAVFGFMFAWSEHIRELGGKRLSALISVVALASMWLAFKLDPEAAMDVVTKPGQELMSNLVEHFEQQIGTTTTTTTTEAESTRSP